jgi:putative membrane protein
MRRLLHLWPASAALLGLVLVVWLIVDAGAEDVGRSMLLVGWGLLPIALFHFVPLSLSALSWRDLLPRSRRLAVTSVIWLRWIRESINALLPAGGVGGDLVCVRLARLRGVPQTEAAASMIVDVTVGVVTQLLFAAIGTLLLLARSTEPTTLKVAWLALGGIGLFSVGTAAFFLSQRSGMLAVSTRLAGRLLGSERTSGAAASASAIDDAVLRIYRDRIGFFRASLVRFAGWVAGTGEIWLVMHFLGRPILVVEAFILESLGAAVRAAAFMVPGQLGILESSFVVFGAMFGLPANAALAISFSRRVRELALGVPGLLVWQWLETHQLLRQRRVG